MSIGTVFRALLAAAAFLGLASRAIALPHAPPVVPLPRPADAQPLPPIDLSHAVPASTLAKLPSTQDQFRTLKNQIQKDRPAVAAAKEKSDALAAEAATLRTKLVATAARVVDLEREQAALDAEIARLQGEDASLTQSLVRDRVPATELLAVLERLQNDLPPAMVLKPDDALGAVRGAMLIGASLPAIYGRAAALAHRIEALRDTRTALVARRAEAIHTAAALAAARTDLDALLARKEADASAASGRYDALQGALENAAAHASDLQALLLRIARLRGAGEDAGSADIVTVTVDPQAGSARPGQLLVPVVGVQVPTPSGPARIPGITFATAPGAQVVAPADSKVLFAGPYHKVGRILILEIASGYDLVLEGLGRVTVRPDDEVLAGEPVGDMADDQAGDKEDDERLYFEIRQNGHGIDPTPWLDLDLRKARKT